jgi:excisionase family DNA binding protein
VAGTRTRATADTESPSLADPVLTPDEVAALLKCTRRKVVKELAYKKKIASFHDGRDLRFRLSAVETYVAERETEAAMKNPRARTK